MEYVVYNYYDNGNGKIWYIYTKLYNNGNSSGPVMDYTWYMTTI